MNDLERIKHFVDKMNTTLTDRVYKLEVQSKDSVRLVLVDDKGNYLREAVAYNTPLVIKYFLYGMVEYEFYMTVKNMDK